MNKIPHWGGLVALTLFLGVLQPSPGLHAQALCAVKGPSGETIYTNAPPSGRCAHPVLLPAPGMRSVAAPFTPGAGRTDARLRPWTGTIDRHARAWGISPQLVSAVIAQESGGNPLAVSRKGALGLMQLMPATASRFSVSDPLDPEANIAGGVQYLSKLIDRYDGNVSLALAAYNAGEGAVDRHKGIPPYRETRDYVRRIMERTGYARARVTPVPAAPVATAPGDAAPAPAPGPPAAPIEVSRGPGGILIFEN